MKPKDIKAILIVMNSDKDALFKYPIGNKELTETVRELEQSGKIKYNQYMRIWSKT